MRPGLSSKEVQQIYKSARDDDAVMANKRRDAEASTAKTIAKRVGGKLVTAAEVGIGAAATGFVAGRTGSTTTFGVPTGLGVSFLYYFADALSFSVYSPLHYVPDEYKPHLDNVVGVGPLAASAAMWGVGQGYLMKQNAEEKAAEAEKPAAPAKAQGQPAKVSGGPRRQMGARPVSVEGHLTEAELQAINQRRMGRR